MDDAGGVIFNAPTVAFNVSEDTLNKMCDGGNVDHTMVHDRVTKICPRDGTITMVTNTGLADGHRFEFISTESNADLVSVLEAAIYAPRLKGLPYTNDDSPFSAIEQNYVTVNGQTGPDNPERQGINSAISDGLSVVDVFSSAPGVGDGYSSAWNIYPIVWNDKARKDKAVKKLNY